MARRKKYQDDPIKITPTIKQARFYCTPGLEPVGYRCEGIEIMRDKNDSTEELRAKCRDSFPWPDANTVHVFTPIN